MRLIQLKLAGFKSFVDPTTIQLQGQRVGIVGPNGCGKSNIMESVKWVLGESSAKEMRSDRMKIKGTVRLTTMQKNGHASNRDVGHHQGKKHDLPPCPIQKSIRQPLN